MDYNQYSLFTLSFITHFLFLFFNILFVYLGCSGSLLLRVGFLYLQRVGFLYLQATPYCGARTSHCGGFSYCRAQALGAQASVVAAHKFRSCGTQAQLLKDKCDLLRPEIKATSPALAGLFLTTGPREVFLFLHNTCNYLTCYFIFICLCIFSIIEFQELLFFSTPTLPAQVVPGILLKFDWCFSNA